MLCHVSLVLIASLLHSQLSTLAEYFSLNIKCHKFSGAVQNVPLCHRNGIVISCHISMNSLDKINILISLQISDSVCYNRLVTEVALAPVLPNIDEEVQ